MVVSVILAPFLCFSYPILPQRGAGGQLRGGLRARGRPLTLEQERQGHDIPARQHQGIRASYAGISASVYTSYTVKKKNVILSASGRISAAQGYPPLHTALLPYRYHG